jgi:hypothetical protein
MRLGTKAARVHMISMRRQIGRFVRFYIKLLPPRANGVNFTPANFDTIPEPRPLKFHTYHFTLYSKGAGNPLDQKHAWVQFNNVGVRIIPQTADNNDRVAMGCDMP